MNDFSEDERLELLDAMEIGFDLSEYEEDLDTLEDLTVG